jgi:hypothetical protein
VADLLDCRMSVALQAIGEQILASDVVQKAYNSLAPLEDAPAELTLDGPPTYPAAVLYYREMVEGAMEEGGGSIRSRLEIGEETVKATVRATAKSRIDFVHMHSKGGSYKALSNHIDRIKYDYGMTDADLAKAVDQVLQGASPSEVVDPDLAPFVADLTWLFYGVETARNPATLVTSAMTMDLIKSGNLSFADALAVPGQKMGGGVFPMSFQGATRASRYFPNVKEVYPGPDPSVQEANELCAREAALVDRWLKSQPPSNLPPEKQVEAFAGKVYQTVEERGMKLRSGSIKQ